jgi:hypothetical protein
MANQQNIINGLFDNLYLNELNINYDENINTKYKTLCKRSVLLKQRKEARRTRHLRFTDDIVDFGIRIPSVNSNLIRTLNMNINNASEA